MEIKKILVVLTLGTVISLNAGVVSAITGPNVSSDDYKSSERGIIVNQDVDGDGILDSKDDDLKSEPCKDCDKEEPKPVVIPDTDGDGVLDNIDECPNTPKGFEVDEVGCSKLVNLKVQFDTGKYNIKTDFTEQLDVFINFIKKHPNYNAVIEGHTDSVGTNENNQLLSENRANSVKTYIIENGIESNRLKSKGFGELNPLNDNITKQDKQENRRVIAVLEK